MKLDSFQFDVSHHILKTFPVCGCIQSLLDTDVSFAKQIIDLKLTHYQHLPKLEIILVLWMSKNESFVYCLTQYLSLYLIVAIHSLTTLQNWYCFLYCRKMSRQNILNCCMSQNYTEFYKEEVMKSVVCFLSSHFKLVDNIGVLMWLF